MATILVIDDEAGIRSAVRGILEDEGYKALVAEDAVVGIETLDREKVDALLLDVWLPRMGGLEALEEIRKRKPELPIIVLSGHGTIDMAVRAMRLGAFDFIEKPLSIERLLASVRNALELSSLKTENKALRRAAEQPPAEELVGSSPSIVEVKKQALQAAAAEARVLITGENGTGKELLAHFIHRSSKRAKGPFVALNCAAIPEGLVESELFGHEKGAFTDAVARRIGRFEAADGGTLFLDEVADLSLQAQAKLLRVLQEMRFERLGGEESISVDSRVIAATNKDIRAEVGAGRFREDLYFRLAVVNLRMPSLRERREDIPELCRLFLAASGSRARRLSDEAVEALAKRNWPGNVRELRNAIERIRVLSDEETIGPEQVLGVLGDEKAIQAEASLVCERYRAMGLSEAKELFERDYLVQKLKDCDYNIAKTAEAIGVYPSGLHAKIKKLGIEP
jgi:two-component system, NtrC family, nitrogen regulation response regulator NtrX